MDQWVNGIHYKVEGSAFSLKVLTLVVTPVSSDSSKGAFWANLSRAWCSQTSGPGGGTR